MIVCGRVCVRVCVSDFTQAIVWEVVCDGVSWAGESQPVWMTECGCVSVSL